MYFMSICPLAHIKMPGSKVMNHDALAYKWLYDLMTRPNMRIKVGCNPTISEYWAGLWECEARNNPYGIFSTCIKI